MFSLITRRSQRLARTWLLPVAAISLLSVCAAFHFNPAQTEQFIPGSLPSAAVRRVSFDVCLTASGVSQSSQQTTVKCQLENLQIRKRGGAFSVGGASTILEIIPNGSMVKKGDVLCTLDASEYEDVADAQELRVLQHQAEAIQTDLALQSAEIALKEYSEGLLPQDLVGMRVRMALAASEMQSASDRLAWSKRMAEKGYASQAQVANERQVLLSASLRSTQAQMEFDTYRKFNTAKTLTSLRADIEKARKWAIHEAGDFDKSKVQLAYYRKLIDRCTIRAPHDGFVIYASGPFAEEIERLMIEAGASVRQGQELFYFPDLTKMEVVAMLNETVADRVRPGMRARVRFELFGGGKDLEGHVESVDDLPRRTYNDVPYYPCRVALEAIPAGLLPGMSAEVEFQVARCHDVLAVDREAVRVDHDRHVCYVIGRSGLECREVTLGGSTPDSIEVTDGLIEGESVVLNPKRVLDSFAFRADRANSDALETAALGVLP
jgi:HlyD family secretion protein